MSQVLGATIDDDLDPPLAGLVELVSGIGLELTFVVSVTDENELVVLLHLKNLDVQKVGRDRFGVFGNVCQTNCHWSFDEFTRSLI